MGQCLALSCIEFAYISQTVGEDGQAHASMQEEIQIMDSFSPWGGKYAKVHQAKLNLAQGDIDAAEQWADANDPDLGGEFEFHREGEYLALARVWIARKWRAPQSCNCSDLTELRPISAPSPYPLLFLLP